MLTGTLKFSTCALPMVRRSSATENELKEEKSLVADLLPK
jgi:hypothetical protein